MQLISFWLLVLRAYQVSSPSFHLPTWSPIQTSGLCSISKPSFESLFGKESYVLWCGWLGTLVSCHTNGLHIIENAQLWKLKRGQLTKLQIQSQSFALEFKICLNFILYYRFWCGAKPSTYSRLEYKLQLCKKYPLASKFQAY